MKRLFYQLCKRAIVLLLGLALAFCVQAGTILNVSKVVYKGTIVYLFGEMHYGNAANQYDALKSFFNQLKKNNQSYTLLLECRRAFREKVKGVYKKVKFPQSQGYFKSFYKDFITQGVGEGLSSSISLVYKKNGNVTQNFDKRRQNYIEKHTEVLAQIKYFLDEIIKSDNGFDTENWKQTKKRIPNVKKLNLDDASTKCFNTFSCFNEKNKSLQDIYRVAIKAIEDFNEQTRKEKDSLLVKHHCLDKIYDDFTGTLISFVEKNCEFGSVEQWKYVNKVITSLDEDLWEVNIRIADLDLWEKIGKAIDKEDNDCIIVHCGDEHRKAVMKCFAVDADATVVGSIDCTQYTNSPELLKEKLLALLDKSEKQNINDNDTAIKEPDTGDEVSVGSGATDNGDTAIGKKDGDTAIDTSTNNTAQTSVRWYNNIVNRFFGFVKKNHKPLSIFGGMAFLGAFYCCFQYLKG